MGIFSVDLDNIKFDDVNFDEDDPETIIHVRLMVWYYRFKQRKAFKEEISKELMPASWHATRCWDWCKPEDKKKEMEPFSFFSRKVI